MKARRVQKESLKALVISGRDAQRRRPGRTRSSTRAARTTDAPRWEARRRWSNGSSMSARGYRRTRSLRTWTCRRAQPRGEDGRRPLDAALQAGRAHRFAARWRGLCCKLALSASSRSTLWAALGRCSTTRASRTSSAPRRRRALVAQRSARHSTAAPPRVCARAHARVARAQPPTNTVLCESQGSAGGVQDRSRRRGARERLRAVLR